MSNYWKRKLKELNEDNSASSGNYWENKQAELKEEEKRNDIAPVVTTAKDKAEDDGGLDFFQKGAFEDGFDWSDLILAPLATVADVGVGVVKGASKLVGGITDAGMYGVAGLADIVGADDFANDVRVKAKENTIDNAFRGIDDSLDKYSVLGKTSDSVAEGLGQVAAIILTGGAAGAAGLGAVGATAVTTGTMGLSSFGSGMSEAYAGGATDEEAATYGLISGVVNAGSELIFGGLGKTVKALGLSKGLSSLDDMFAQKLSSKIANQTAKNFVEFGVKASAEGVEEVLAGIGTIAGKKLTYMSEEELSKLIEDENLLEQFVVGAVTSGISQSGIVPGMKGGSLSESNQNGRDFITGLTKNEQAVVDKEYADRIAEEGKNGKVTEKRKAEIYDEVLSDMEKGHITTDTIEEVLGGDSYKAYQDTIKSEEEALNELAELYEGEELQQQINDFLSHSQRDGMQAKLSESVFETVKGDRLAESYLDRARRGETFKADLTKYDAKVQPMIQKAIDSGVLNNTNRTHEFVDMIAKIATDKGVSFDFTSNEKLKDSIFAVDGKTVNGFVTEDGVTLNVNSAKALNKVVGHEITHVLEGTELYTELQNVLFEYAKGRKAVDSKFDSEYKERLYNARNLYKDVDGYQGVDGFNKIKNEVAADLVGDYLFSDTDFIKKLSVEHRNVFQKMFDEVKYLCKVATAGSKEARELAKLKKAFEDAYRDGGKQTEDTKYSLTLGKLADISVDVESDIVPYGIKSYNDYIGVQNAVYNKLLQDGFFDDSTKRRVVENADTGISVEIGWRGIKETFGKGKRYEQLPADLKRLKIATVKHLPEIIRYGEVVESGVNEYHHNNPDLKYTYIQHPITVGGKTMYVTVDIRQSKQKDMFWLHGVYLDKKISQTLDASTDEAGQTINKGLANGENVAQEPPKVKRDYSLSDSDGRSLSPAVQKRFGNSKVVDENGSLKVVYHGTATGEFSIFDKAKGNVEGDFGSGFYFTDNEADVSEHYEGGGPDFEQKVALLAERIEAEEEIGYDIAKIMAREKLYKGSHKFEVYLNIENPAIVGETMLLNSDSYMEQYNEEDYDDYDDYLADVEQLVADDIDNVIWEVERNVDVNDTEGISGVLWDAYSEGGIGLEELKARLNNLYLEDSNGNFVANEVARQIIESLGYDGIVDPTVSGKWNMDIEEGTTHYIVFKPNQIKAVTNENPTDNPDIHRSLSRAGEQYAPTSRNDVFGKDIALETAPVKEVAPVQKSAPATVAENATVPDVAPVAKHEESMLPDDLAPLPEDGTERIDSLTDADAPPEVDAPYYEDGEVAPDNPMEGRYIEDVGDRSVKAYMYENPEVKPFFQAEANVLLGELHNSIKGERWYNDQVYYESGGEYGWGGVKRDVSDDIAYLLDGGWNGNGKGYTYKQIEDGLKAIIEDHGAENNAVSKRIEFILNDRLMQGHPNFPLDGMDTPPNQDYLRLLEEKQITEYSKEAFDAFMANADDYAPPVEEDIAPVPTQAAPVAPVVAEMAAPVKEASLSIKPKAQKEPRMARATPQEQARAQVLTEEPKVDKSKPTAWNLFKDNFVDKGTVFETLSLKTGNRELQAKWKSIGRAESSAQWFMEHGSADTRSLKAIRETVEQSGKTQQFYEYLYHRHNVDRMNLEERYADTENKPVFGYDVTSEMSKAEAAKLEAANPKFKVWAEDVYSYMTTLREMMVDNGVISRETADLWAEMYPHYVPVRRKGDNDLNINVALDTKRTGVNAPIKRATGGNRDILPLFDTMAMRTEQTYRAVARNRFGVELKNLLGTTVEHGALSVDEAIDSVENEELLQAGKDGNNPTFTVFENGEKVTFEITEEMYDTMKPKSKGLAYTNKFLNTANNIRRGLLTEYNPAFMLTNPIKDTQDVILNSQHPAKTYANYPAAIAELIGKNGQYYREYMEHGGEMNTYFDGETKTFAKEKSGLAKVLGFPLDKISQANNFIERIPRMAEYIASRKEGRSIDVSMLDAARVTTDFSAGGDLVKFANRNGFTFLNASVQGAAQQVRNVREAKAEGLKGWAKLAAKVAVAGLPSILLNHLLWDDDEEYAELSDYVKQNYYIVGKYGDGKFVRIPKGRALAVIQNGFEQMENLVTGNDEVDLEAFSELVMSNLAPNNPLENNIAAPVMQAWKNKAWYGDALVPTRLQDLPAAEQYDETTDSISKWLGEKLNISPYKINYILDQYSGGVGDMLLPMLTPEAERGNDSLVGNLLAPITDKFTTDSVLKNQNVSDFYDTKDELSMNAKASGATEEDVLMSKYMNSINAELSDLYKRKRELQNSTYSDDVKYNAVRDIQNQIVELTRESLSAYEDVSITGNYATVGDRHYRRNDDGEWTKITDKQLEKQREVTSGLGIRASDYWGNKEEYDYAYENPEKYAVAKSVGGYASYKDYSSQLYDIKADKGADGKSITGSRKEKVIDWINELDADYGTKIILFKNEYNGDDTYNRDIIDYLNSRNDLSYKDVETILKELGFEVDSEGNIYW